MKINQINRYEIVKIRNYEKLTPFRYEYGGPRSIYAGEYVLKVIDKLLADAAS